MHVDSIDGLHDLQGTWLSMKYMVEIGKDLRVKHHSTSMFEPLKDCRPEFAHLKDFFL